MKLVHTTTQRQKPRRVSSNRHRTGSFCLEILPRNSFSVLSVISINLRSNVLKQCCVIKYPKWPIDYMKSRTYIFQRILPKIDIEDYFWIYWAKDCSYVMRIIVKVPYPSKLWYFAFSFINFLLTKVCALNIEFIGCSAIQSKKKFSLDSVFPVLNRNIS